MNRISRIVGGAPIALLLFACHLLASGCAGRSEGGDLRASMPLSAIGESRQHVSPWQAREKISPQGPTEAEPVDPRALPMFDGHTGQPVVWSELVARAAASDIVLIGETHGQVSGLDAAACLFDDLLTTLPDITLAMEFFERDQQVAIDDYLSGVIDEETFRRMTGRTAGNYPDGHRRMVEAAKGAQRPVVGANAPRRYVRLARTDGFERLTALSESQRSLFVAPESLSEGTYREEFMKLMGAMEGHGAEGEADPAATPEEQEKAEKARAQALSFFRSQNVWDATMAESVLRLVAADARPVVLVAGRFHTDFEGGLTQRLRDALPSARILTLSFLDEAPHDQALREQDKGRAGVVVYVRRSGE